jgi:superfamily II DNA or RNA helicase
MDRKKIIIKKKYNEVTINNTTIIKHQQQDVNDDTYNGLVIFIKNSIKKNLSLPDILKNETYKDKEIKRQLAVIYNKLIMDTIDNPENNEEADENDDIEDDDIEDDDIEDYDIEDDDIEDDDIEDDVDDEETIEQIINNNDIPIIKRNKIQKLYIDDAYDELILNNRVMIVGPTGFGKTVVNYMLINKLNPKLTFIFTPRRNLNKQTLDEKYKKYLNSSNYVFYNYSPETQYKSSNTKFINLAKFIKLNKKLNKNIIVLVCYQSCKTLLPKLLKFGIRINLAIADECHTISCWGLLSKNYHKLFLENNNIIEKYIFATATPKSDMKISPYNLLFGKVIEHCQIYELIEWGILCDFETIVKNIDFDKKKLDLSKFIMEIMIKYNKKKGVIYVNSQKNAMELYAYIKFKFPNFDTFIYISEKLTQDSFKDFKYNIEFNSNDTKLECFENCNNQCLIITCNKISYGYDNVFIDLICFADPRQSEEDNRQITGRGLRNDISKYPNKVLHIILPTSEKHLLNKYQNVDDTNTNTDSKDNIYIEFNKIKAFLEFIINQCGKDIINGRIQTTINLQKTSVISLTNAKDYSGDTIPSEIIKELSTTFYKKYNKFLGFLRNHKVYNEETYNLIREKPENIEWMPLLGNIRDTYKKFCFLDIKSPENANYYQTLEEYNEAYETIKTEVIQELGGLLQIRKLKLLNSSIEDKIQKKNSECGNKIPTNKYLFYYNEVD